MINVFIADDHQIVREGLKHIINAEKDMSICGEAVDGHELSKTLLAINADILLLDVSMPGPGFLETLRRVSRSIPNLKILILSAHAEEQYAKRSFKAGAKGYLTKNHSPAELVTAVRRLAGGGRYISQSLAELMAFDMGDENDSMPHESLSQREYQILCLIGSGKRVGAIADSLSLSPKTISTYRSRLLEKMGLSNTSELIHYVLDNNLAENNFTRVK